MFHFIAWIVKLGPQNYGDDNLYSYLIGAGAPSLQPLIVLVRDLHEFHSNHDTAVKNWLQANNFSDPVPCNQRRECIFAEVPGEVLF